MIGRDLPVPDRQPRKPGTPEELYKAFHAIHEHIDSVRSVMTLFFQLYCHPLNFSIKRLEQGSGFFRRPYSEV